MEICSGRGLNSHDEIVFEGNKCPLCVAVEEIKSLESEVERLNNQE
jgi:hypothetical protein